MSNVIQPFHFLVIALTGWINRRQQTVIGEGEPKDSVDQDTDGQIQCCERLGGMLNFYYREAA